MNKLAIVIALALYLGILAWLLVRSLQALPSIGWLQAVFSVLLVCVAFSFFVAMGLGNRLPFRLTAVLENVGAYWVISLLYLVMAVLFFDLVRLSNHFLKFFPDWVYAHYPQVKLGIFLSVIGLIAAMFIAGNYRFAHPTVREVKITLPRGQGGAGTLTLAVASDVHLGYIIRKQRLRKYVELLNRQQADVILFAGDLVDHSPRPVEVQRMDEELRQLNAPLGVYGIFGNHEYYGNVAGAAEFYRRSGITLLRDSTVTVDGRFLLIGRDDVSYRHRKPLDRLLEATSHDLPRILLDHNPSNLAEAGRNGINLQISGHTHDGQIFPLNLLVRRIYPLSYGYMQQGSTHYYVSSGLGLWAAPVRIGTRSEIVRIELTLE